MCLIMLLEACLLHYLSLTSTSPRMIVRCPRSSKPQALLVAGALPALMALVSSGSDKCREAAADALAALGDVAARDPANRELLKLKVCCYPL